MKGCSFYLFIILFLFYSPSFAQTRNLDFFLSAGLSNSPLLKDFQNQVSANAIDSQRFRAGYKPQVTGISNNTIAPYINGWGYDPALSNIASFNELVNVDKTFIGKNNVAARSKNFSLLSDSVINARKLTEQDLKRTITAQYISAYGDYQQLSFYSGIINLLRNQEMILKKLTESNIYRQTDYLTFLVTLKQQELQWKQLRIQYRNDFAMLNYLCGIFDTSTAVLEAPGVVLQRLPEAASSAFFYKFINDSLSLKNNLSILSFSYRPRLDAFANAGFSSSFLYQAYKNFGFSLGMNLNVPIYDGHQRQMQQHKIELQQNTNAGYKDFFTQQYDQQIAMLRQQLASTEALIEDINEQIKYSEGLIEVNGKLLETGDAKIPDLVIAINNYLAAKNLLTQNNLSRMQIINQLNYWNR